MNPSFVFNLSYTLISENMIMSVNFMLTKYDSLSIIMIPSFSYGNLRDPVRSSFLIDRNHKQTKKIKKI